MDPMLDPIECKRDPSEFDPAGLKAFRALYPDGDNYLVCPLVGHPYLVVRSPTEIRAPVGATGPVAKSPLDLLRSKARLTA